MSNNIILEYIEELKKKYKIGMLSNISGDWLQELFTDEQIALFDATALSYETGYAKPDRRAYDAILERIQFNPEDCIYIDDQPTFVNKAKEMGMKTIHYTDFDSFKNELEAMLEMTDAD
jgi:putative hydrolase of the HAD superfamily